MKKLIAILLTLTLAMILVTSAFATDEAAAPTRMNIFTVDSVSPK